MIFSSRTKMINPMIFQDTVSVKIVKIDMSGMLKKALLR